MPNWAGVVVLLQGWSHLARLAYPACLMRCAESMGFSLVRLTAQSALQACTASHKHHVNILQTIADAVLSDLSAGAGRVHAPRGAAPVVVQVLQGLRQKWLKMARNGLIWPEMA